MATNDDSPVWLITGCSSGFGASLALRALRGGHRVVATSRTPSTTPTLVAEVESLGGTWLSLDVNLPHPSLGTSLDKALAVYGRIDILVNNAGYAILGAIESLSESECRAQMETNFFAPLRITQHLLPHMRSKPSSSSSFSSSLSKSTIVNISSIAGIEALPSFGLYAASKFALEGLSEALAREVESLGVRVLVVEPGAFRSKFLTNYKQAEAGAVPDAYRGTGVEQMCKLLASANGRQSGDVEKGVERIWEMVTGTGMFAGGEMAGVRKVMLGKDCESGAWAKVKELEGNLELTKEVIRSTDYVEG